MALRTKISWAEEVLNTLQSNFGTRDIGIDPREVILRLDQEVNEMAKAGQLENWKMNLGEYVDDQFVTSWEWLTLTDPANKAPSYVQIPAQYATLNDNRGIDQVYFENSFSAVKKKYFSPVIITSFKDLSSYRNTMGGELDERISCYPKGGNLIFDRGNVGATYGRIGLRLVVRDSSAVADDQPYPIPADRQKMIMDSVINFFTSRLSRPQDLIKDAVDSQPPQPQRRPSQ